MEQEPLIGSSQQRPPSYTELPNPPPSTGNVTYLQAYQQQGRATEQASCYDNDDKVLPPLSPYPEPNPNSLSNGWASIPPPDPPVDSGILHESDVPILKPIQTCFSMARIITVLWLLAFPLTWPALPFALTALCFAMHSRRLANKSGDSYYENAKINGKRALCCSIFSIVVAFISGTLFLILIPVACIVIFVYHINIGIF